jgi:ubiquinone/menaquinone biosynthesis C-methylase UbiE
MIERRKNIRISYESSVRFISENHSFQGKLVDISRSGMKIVADIPESPETIENIAFRLPKSDTPLQLPYKLIRKERGPSREEGQVLGIELLYQDETQMLLVESFIKEMKRAELLTRAKNAEMRQIPRANCVITDISCDRTGISVLSIDNISIDGMSISYRGKGLSFQDIVTLSFRLPDDPRDLHVSGTVIYTLKNAFSDAANAGIVFNNLSDIDGIRIKNFISSSTAAMAMKALYEKLSDVNFDETYVIHDRATIESIFSLLNADQIHMNVLFENNHRIQELPFIKYSSKNRIFCIEQVDWPSILNFKNDQLGYFSFNTRMGSYYFKANLLKKLDRRAYFPLPDILYRSEKRAQQRKIAEERIAFTDVPEHISEGSLQGVIKNISRHGFMCEVPFEAGSRDFFYPSRIVNYRTNEELGLSTYGEIRYVSKNIVQNNKAVLRIGVESGIKHTPFQFTRFSETQWDKLFPPQGNLPLSARDKIDSVVVKYHNKKGQRITALVNSTHRKLTAPVIVIPPAFGKKKEALSPFVATLITNFRCLNKKLVTIRYDGINLPGESDNEEMLPKRGYEMLYYRISQGQDDLQATLEYVYNNSFFKPDKVIVVAFSLSALDVRKLVSAPHEHKVDYVINVMGVSCGQSVFKNMTGGLDIIGYYKLGIVNGLFGILGHILDMDNLAEDLIEKKYAYMTDARLDMSRISTPILWIYGKYDKWIDENEVRELMGIESEGSREVIEIPTGHNLRSSEDAIKTFKLITSRIHKKIYGEDILPIDPDRDSLVNLIGYERERLASAEEFNSEEYWKQYLIGKRANSFGYDFYKNIKEFREFLSLESQLTDLSDKEILVDMGCGTGLLVEDMLNLTAARQRDVRNAQIIMIDLVKEALDKAQKKIDRIKLLHEAFLPQRITYRVMDLEPNRLIPVHTFVNNLDLDFNYLRNRIEGLANASIDRFLNKSSIRLYEIMRGASLTRSDEANINSEFNKEDRQVIMEFNRAARFLKRQLRKDEVVNPNLATNAAIESNDYDQLRTSDLQFEKLEFGNSGLRLHSDFQKGSVDKIIASLFISYLFNPDDIFHDFYRMLKPNGLLLVSSMKPDSDISRIFTNYVDKVQHFDFSDTDFKSQDISLSGAREMLNEAATLFELEEEGYFKFYSDKELVHMFKSSGFDDIQVQASLGNPPQAYIVTGRKF